MVPVLVDLSPETTYKYPLFGPTCKSVTISKPPANNNNARLSLVTILSAREVGKERSVLQHFRIDHTTKLSPDIYLSCKKCKCWRFSQA
jgi:hypothetical protein